MTITAFQLRVIVHLIAVLQYWFALYYDGNYVIIPKEVKFAGKLKYLTTWDAYVQASFFTLCLMNDVIGNNKSSKSNLCKIKDLFQATIAFPLALFVAVVFWSLYAIDRELVFPEYLDEFVPSWLNHVVHTNIVVFELLEMTLNRCKYPSRCQGLTIISTFIVTYIAWVLIIFNKVHHWVYPILAIFNWSQRLLFFGGCIALAAAMYLVGELLNSILFSRHSSETDEASAVKKERNVTKKQKLA